MGRNLKGSKFGNWTVMDQAVNSAGGDTRWLCKCSCPKGTKRVVYESNLLKGKSRGCGCYKEKCSRTSNPLYLLWLSLRGRCYIKNNLLYKHYGAKGVTLCDRWLDFNLFSEDVMPYYDKRKKGKGKGKVSQRRNLFLHLKDPTGEYSLVNCEFKDKLYNAGYEYIMYEGKQISISRAARILGVSRQCVHNKKKRGYTDDQIMGVGQRSRDEPIKYSRTYDISLEEIREITVEYEGEIYDLVKIASLVHISPYAMYKRYKRNWPVEDLFKKNRRNTSKGDGVGRPTEILVSVNDVLISMSDLSEKTGISLGVLYRRYHSSKNADKFMNKVDISKLIF